MAIVLFVAAVVGYFNHHKLAPAIDEARTIAGWLFLAEMVYLTYQGRRWLKVPPNRGCFTWTFAYLTILGPLAGCVAVVVFLGAGALGWVGFRLPGLHGVGGHRRRLGPGGHEKNLSSLSGARVEVRELLLQVRC